MNDHERIDKLEDRQTETEKVVFNGLQDACAKMGKWLDEKAPNLMTREEHEKLDEKRERDTVEHNRQIGKKKDRRLVALGIAVTVIVPFATAGFMKLMESI
jgi:hypothetical protein